MNDKSPGSTQRLVICGLLVALTLACGIAMNSIKPVWLVPPLSRTLVLYLVLGMAWLPVTVVCAWVVRRDLRPWMLMLAILAVFLIGVGGCSLFISSQINANVLVQDAAPCEQESLPGQRVRYICTLTVFFYYEVYTLEGPQGSPFLRLVDFQTGGT